MTLDRSKPPDLGRIERARNQWILDLHQRRFPRQTQRDQLVDPASVTASGVPQAWCAEDDEAVFSEGDTFTLDVTIDTSQTHVLVFATFIIFNTSAAGFVSVSGYFRSGGTDLNNQVAYRYTDSLANGGYQTISASCLVEAGSTVGASLTNASVGSREIQLVSASVQVVEVSAQTGACCVVGA